MNKKLIIIYIFFLLISCNSKELNKKSNTLIDEDVENLVKTEKDTIYHKPSLLLQDIDVQNIKSQLDGATTGFLSKKEVNFFLDRKKNNFYGFYMLNIIDNNFDDSYRRVGELIIYDSINPYIYEKNTDEFVEITLTKKGVKIYNDSLRIGMTEKELINVLEKKYDRYNETLIFSSENKKGFFKIKDSLVSKIKIGIYRDSIDVEKLLRKSYW